MGWFSDQIEQRTKNDQNLVEDSFFRLAQVIMDQWDAERLEDQRLIAKGAIEDILKYFRIKFTEIPEDIESIIDQLEYAIRPNGLMVREVQLEENWQRNCYGPMLGSLKDSGIVVALLPGAVFGYYYKDPATGKKIRINNKTAKAFSSEAMCFYRPLPMKKLGIPDLLLYMRKSITRSDIIMIVLATLAVTLTGMVEPRIYSLVTGKAMVKHNVPLIIGLGIFLFSSAFAGQMMNLIRSLLMQRIATKTTVAVEASVMMRVLSLPVSFFRNYSSGELSTRVGCVNTLCENIMGSIFSTGLTSLMSLLFITQIMHFAPALLWPSVIITLSTIIFSLIASFMQIGISQKRMQIDAEEHGFSYAILNGMQKIRLSGSEKRVFAKWAGIYSKGARLDYNPPLFLKLNSMITACIPLLGMIPLYYLAVKTGVTQSEYYAFNAAYGRVSGAFIALSEIAISMASIRPILKMSEPILKAEPEVNEEKKPVERLKGNITLSHVSFRYREDTPYIVDDLNLNIKAGEYVAIVGRTGCGKSTLVKLLLGFEKPEKGSIYYDHHDFENVDPRSVRKNIGVVIQNGQLVQGDIFSNITISAPQLSMDEAWEAAETAGIAADIREMPMGMMTMISEGQGGISGGQKQRLLIARAIAPKPKILIFDEATSALDNKTQKQVSDALDRLECTRIVIAHRLSTIRNCDRILVLENGKVTEEGTYEELIAQNGFFADLVERQRLDV